MNVAIAVPVLANGDAVGHDALGMAATLRHAGHRVQFHAEKSLIHEDVQPLSSLIHSPADALIYHHSHGCAVGVDAALSFAGPVAVKYHNVTPAEFFPEGSEVRAAAAAGLLQMRQLASAGLQFWVDSPFNARGLEVECHTLPPFMQTESLLAAEPDAETAMAFDSGATTLLMVGRVAPNKNIFLALKALAEYRRQDTTARLIIAGGHVFADYSELVQETIDELQLRDAVIITGRVTVSQLKALYCAADTLLVTSADEGFCVPLVEAMALAVPIVAVNSSAIPDTAGNGACLVNSESAAIAEAIGHVLTDRALREHHLQAGMLRYHSVFANVRLAERFMELFETLQSAPTRHQ